MKYSNPIPNYKFKAGNIPYYVAIELDSWIPVSVIVFAKDKQNALQIVKEGIVFILQQSNDMLPKDAADLLTEKAKITVQEINKKQLYKVGWAVNDTILDCSIE